MNEKASRISADYMAALQIAVNQYIQLKTRHSDVALEPVKRILWRMGMLVEIWSCIKKQQKERKHG